MWKSALLLLILLTFSSCEQRTTVELAEEPSLVLIVSGSGRLTELTIYGPEHEEDGHSQNTTNAIWKIIPQEDDGERVSKLHEVRYGLVPSGYKQMIPSNGSAPVPLLTEKRYSYRLVTINAPHASGYFELRDGRPTKVKGPCFELHDDKWVRVDCSN